MLAKFGVFAVVPNHTLINQLEFFIPLSPTAYDDYDGNFGGHGNKAMILFLEAVIAGHE